MPASVTNLLHFSCRFINVTMMNLPPLVNLFGAKEQGSADDVRLFTIFCLLSHHWMLFVCVIHRNRNRR